MVLSNKQLNEKMNELMNEKIEVLFDFYII